MTVVAGLASMLVAPGCVQMHPTRCGFLSDYRCMARVESRLRVIGKGDARLVRWAGASDLHNIDSFFIEPVAWLADDLGQPAGSRSSRERVRLALREALAERLGEIRPVVREAGPRTAVVRAAVTGVQEAKPIVNTMILAFSGPLFNGGAVVEVEILSPDGEQLSAESIAVQGRDWEVVGFFHRSRHTERAVRRAAAVLAEDLLEE